MKRRIGAILLVIVGGLIVGTAGVYHFRPLIKTSDFSVKVSGELKATAYRMLGRETLFIELRDESAMTEEWFIVRFSSKTVCSPNRPGRSPYLHFNHDMGLGVAITDSKFGEGWQIRGDDRYLIFSHPEKFSVSIRKASGSEDG